MEKLTVNHKNSYLMDMLLWLVNEEKDALIYLSIPFRPSIFNYLKNTSVLNHLKTKYIQWVCPKKLFGVYIVNSDNT